MATAPVLPLISAEEYLNSSYSPDTEYVDGNLVERSVPTPAHGILAAIVSAYLFSMRLRYGFVVVSECRTQIVQGRRYRIPDLLLCGPPVAPGKVLEAVPWVVIEILSPADRTTDQIERFRDYVSIGVRQIVLLDPELHLAWRFEDDSLLKTEFAELYLPTGQAVAFDSVALFEQLDEEMRR